MLLRIFPVILAAAIFALDQWTKWLINVRLPRPEEGGFVVIPGWFNIVHEENPGVAFGLLSNSTSQWRGAILITVSAVVLGYSAGDVDSLCADPGRRAGQSVRSRGARHGDRFH